jgi:L-threonylcarbamoyladenylate synthase
MTDFSEDIHQCLQVLSKGGVILYPTDTVWGLGCDATNKQAAEKIFQIKQRPEAKSLIVLMADEREVLRYIANPDLEVFDYLQTVHKPTTVIYSGAIGLADNIIHADGSVGIRIVDDPFCKNLIKRFRKPIVSTSCNISGAPAPRFFAEITDTIKSSVDYVVQYRRYDTSPSEPSSVIRWTKGRVEVLRP